MNLMPPMQNSWSQPQRQARGGIWVILTKTIISFIKTFWPALIVLVFRRGSRGLDSFEILFIIAPVLFLLRSLIEFYYFRFQILDGELVVRKGVLSKKTIIIPLEKIQAVHIEQGPLHQLTKVARVRIDTAGSDKTEATIEALDMAKAEQLKTFLLQELQVYTEDGTVAATIETPIITLGASDLLKLGLSANHIQAFFVVLAFAITSLNNLDEAFGSRVVQTIKSSSKAFHATIASIAIITMLVLLILIVVSMTRILLAYFNFELAETAQGYKIRSGLINSRQNLVPYTKIQYISWEGNWVRRMLGLYNLEFHQVTGSLDNNHQKRKVTVPVTRPSFIDLLLQQYHPAVQPNADSEHRIAPEYPLRRALIVGVLPLLIALPITAIWYWQAGLLWTLLWIPYVWLNAIFFRRNFRLYLSPGALQVKRGVWGREYEVVQWYKIQQVVLKQSIFQRRKGLATLLLNTAGGAISIPWIPLALAQRIRNYALYAIESADRNWM
ncbi:MAG: PH domain-containing protein [Candidatus Pseudobacter hemicellulosilyticus]|uniref:PH domain-containing protein n=1 Tax=Candidatus Pseudobacter hemicellulosilyticus TaxID=3121375 RepID=A0AAJ5WV58_9BACT|nr:MAG: PH domain-containing protein [Pseudobacter sp.]